MTLEKLEQKMDALAHDVAAVHSTVKDRYSALDARLDQGVHLVVKSKWTPVCVGVYSVALLWIGMAIERWV